MKELGFRLVMSLFCMLNHVNTWIQCRDIRSRDRPP